MYLSSFLSVGLSLVAAVSAKDYRGYKVMRAFTTNDASVARINHAIDLLSLDTWKRAHIAGDFSDVVVPQHQVDAFGALIKGHATEILHHDLAVSMNIETTAAKCGPGNINSSWFNSYHPFEDHLTWINDLVKQYPQNAELINLGKSFEYNNIVGVHIWGDAKGRPAVYLQSTIHPREWITTMVNEYIMYSLMSSYGSGHNVSNYLNKYDFYIVPVANPDGFRETQKGDRFWRKNTQPNVGAEADCNGVDLNRNWPYQWVGEDGPSSPCFEMYPGQSAGSTPEVKAITSFLTSIKKKQGVKLFVDWHSYSQLVMTPYSWTCDKIPAGNDKLLSLAHGMADAIKTIHGTRFQSGPVCKLNGNASGGSIDWTTDVLKADYSFGIELRDTGKYGFLLPPAQILPSAEEAFAGVKYLLDNMK